MILDKLFSTRASLENPSTSLSNPANWLFEAFGSVPSASSVAVNERNATQITAYWSAVNTIADTLGELPVKLIWNKRNGEQKVVQDHPALSLIRGKPNEMMTSVVFKSTLQGHVLTWGNGYAYVQRNRLGEPLAMWPLAPNETKPVVENRQLWFDTQLDEQATRVAATNVIHVPALSRNGIEGMSVIREQREMLGATLAAQDFGARFFGNGAHPGGIVSFPGRIQDPDKVRNQIEGQTSGTNAHRMIVLDGDAKYTQFTIPPDDAQFLQTREFSVDEIGRMFRLPLHFLNKMGQATFNNLEMMGSHFVQYTMMPWIIRWEQELTKKLLTESEIRRGYVFKFNVAALIRGDIKTRSDVYTSAITNGWMTRNEVRALEDMNPLDGLDDPLIPLNLGIVGEEKDEPTDEPDEDTDESDEGTDEEDEGTDEESEDEDDARMFLIVKVAAERLAVREVKRVRSLMNRCETDEELSEALEAFYTSHQELIESNLKVSEQRAKDYCWTHALELVDAMKADATEDLFLRWQTEDATQLAQEIVL